MIRIEPDIHPFQITLTTLAGVLAQSSQRYMIAALDAFPAEWDRLEFSYQGQPAALVRVPRPEKADEAVLEVSPDFYLSAYILQCPHEGCVVRLHPVNPQKLVCRCESDVFWAKDGMLVTGVADRGLQRIGLEVVGNRVYATGPSKAAGQRRGSKLMKLQPRPKLTMG